VSRAREWLASGSTTPADVAIDVYEFDSGYVVWPRVANPAGGRGMPDLGGARAVVDRDSGELTTWPMLPPETIAQRYTVDRQARRRFPPDVFTDLRMAGWRPGRNVDAAVTLWLDRTDIERVLPIFPP